MLDSEFIFTEENCMGTCVGVFQSQGGKESEFSFLSDINLQEVYI